MSWDASSFLRDSILKFCIQASLSSEVIGQWLAIALNAVVQQGISAKRCQCKTVSAQNGVAAVVLDLRPVKFLSGRVASASSLCCLAGDH